MNKKKKSRLIGVATIIVLAGIAMGQGPCEFPGCSISFPPLRYVFLFVNTEDKLGVYQTAPVFTILGGSRMVGAAPAGTLLNVYSNLGTDDSNLQVIDPTNGETVMVSNEAQRAASLIRDYYIEYNPYLTSYQRQNWNFTFFYANNNPQYPVLSVALFPTTRGGLGAIHRVKLLAYYQDIIPAGGDPEGSKISVQIVDAGRTTRAWLDRAGREHYIREGSTGIWNPEITSINPMKWSPVSIGPGDLVPVGFQPTITVNQQLGLISAAIYWTDYTSSPPSPWNNFLPYFYNRGPIYAHVSTETRNYAGPYEDSWTYTFVPDQPLQEGTDYMFVIEVAIKDNPDGYGGIPPMMFQAGTQNRQGNLIAWLGDLVLSSPYCDEFRDYVPPLQIPGGCDAGFLTSGTPNSVWVIPFFFKTDSGNLTMPIPNPGNPGEFPLIPANVTIKPEVLRINDGVFTAIVSFPDNYDVSTITSCYANGAAATQMNLNTEGKFLVCHFRRDQITYHMGTTFVVYGQTSDDYYFTGMDKIQRIME